MRRNSECNMSIKKFFKRQFQSQKFLLQHDVISDFYLSSFQNNRSTVPLIIVRTIIFVGCLSIVIASLVLTSRSIPLRFWPIYMTHWGIILNTIAAGFALFVSAMASIKSSIDTSPGLPWYVQVYWAMFNLSTAIAFFITVFYWALLTNIEQDFAINLTLDIFIHAVNSILMLALVVSSRHPAHILHFYVPIGFGIIYLIFSAVYYVLDGKDVFGNHTIYPMIDWKKPGQTLGIAAVSAVGIALLHGVVVGFAAGRDFLSRRCRKRNTAYDIDDAYY